MLYKNMAIASYIAFLMISVAACSSTNEGLLLPRNVIEIADFRLEMKWCSVGADRAAECEFEMISLYQDRRAGLAYPKIQDERGNDYKLNTGNQPAGGAKMAADQTYRFRFSASNLPSYVKQVRNVTGIFVSTLPNGTKVVQKEVTFANVPVRELASATQAEVVIENEAKSGALSPGLTTLLDFDHPNTWQTVGLWNYDAEDGQLLSQGLVLRATQELDQKKRWASYIELNKHESLKPKNRTVWPVKINLQQRTVCANYTGYPTYQGHIDLPGDQYDGNYQFSFCDGEN